VTPQASEPASPATEPLVAQVAQTPAVETEAEPQVITSEQAENKTP